MYPRTGPCHCPAGTRHYDRGLEIAIGLGDGRAHDDVLGVVEDDLDAAARAETLATKRQGLARFCPARGGHDGRGHNARRARARGGC